MVLPITIPWLLTLTLTILTILWLWTKTRRTYIKYNIPPFPVKPWPIVGHFFMMRGNLREKMKEWRKKAGDIYSLDIGGQLQVVVNDYNIIKDIWVKKADHINNLPRSFHSEILEEDDKGISGGRDDNWKEQRATSLSILRSFGMGKNVMADKIGEEVSCILEKLVAFKGQPEDVRLLLNVSVSNVICSVAVGKRFEHEDHYFVQFMIKLQYSVKYTRFITIVTPFQFLYYLPVDLFGVKKWTKASLYKKEKFCKAYVKELKETFNENEEPQNFVTAYTKGMKRLQNKGIKTNLSEENLVAIIRTLFLAGTETTSTTILWCLLYMLHYPKVQEQFTKKLRQMWGLLVSPM